MRRKTTTTGENTDNFIKFYGIAIDKHKKTNFFAIEGVRLFKIFNEWKDLHKYQTQMKSDTFFNQLSKLGWKKRKISFVKFRETETKEKRKKRIDTKATRKDVFCFDSTPLKPFLGNDFEFALNMEDLYSDE